MMSLCYLTKINLPIRRKDKWTVVLVQFSTKAQVLIPFTHAIVCYVPGLRQITLPFVRASLNSSSSAEFRLPYVS